MRVLMMSRHGSTKGGAESYLRGLTRELAERGHTVAVASHLDRDDSWPEVRDGFTLAATASHSVDPATSERAEVTRVLEAFRPDVVHVHNVSAAWLAPLVAHTTPTILAVHDHRVSCPTGTRYWTAWKRSCGVVPGPVCLGYNAVAHCGSLRANATLKPYRSWRAWRDAALGLAHLQVFSEYMATTLKLAGISRAGVFVTPYPAPNLGAPSAQPEDDARPVVFATGRLTKEKGFAALLDALDRVQTPVLCAIAGTGHDASSLSARAAGVASRHEVRFLGWLPSEALSAWYARAALVAVPSAWPEPFGIVGLEAMSAGRSVVAFDVGGVREWLRDGANGIAVPAGDVPGFAAAIDRLLGDPTLRTRLGSAGAELAKTEFSPSGHAERVEAMYERARSEVSAA